VDPDKLTKLLVDGVEILQTTAMNQWGASPLMGPASMTPLLQQAPELEVQVQMGSADLGSEPAHQINAAHLQDFGMSFLRLTHLLEGIFCRKSQSPNSKDQNL
jgi:hypothetical protein